MAAWVAALALTLLSSSPLAAAAALPATVAVTIGAAVSAPVPAAFVSLSMEIDDAPRYLGAAGSTSAGWVRLMRLLAAQTPGAPGPTLRIGGDSSDYSLWWDPAPAPALPPRQQYAITRADLAAYRAAVTQWGGALVLGSTLFLENNATFAGAHARGISEHLGWGLVDAVEVGNEPEGFNGEEALRSRSWGPLDYSREFYAHVLAMRAAGMPGGAFLQGAVFGGNDTAFDGSFANYTSAYAALGVLRSVSRHHYSLSACGGGAGAPPTPAALLASVAATRAFLAPFAAAARAAGVEFRVGEYNSAACGGAKGTSDTFAASLWALDSLLALASLNASQVNVHGGPHNAYSPIHTRAPSTAPIVMPAFYGMWAAAAALANASVVLAASATGSGAGALLGVHALQEGAGAGGVLRVVVVHKDPSGSDARVSVAPPPSALASARAWAPLASLTRLQSAGGVLEQYNISWGGLTFLGTQDGVPVPSGSPASEAVPLVGGLYSFDVPRGSAATLRFTRA
jgi:hypothetical protein